MDLLRWKRPLAIYLHTPHVIDIQQDRAWYAQMPATDPVLPEDPMQRNWRM
ncbi:hypothetical protein P4S72_11920 [Vibrio sp. PP-XX7]